MHSYHLLGMPYDAVVKSGSVGCWWKTFQSRRCIVLQQRLLAQSLDTCSLLLVVAHNTCLDTQKHRTKLSGSITDSLCMCLACFPRPLSRPSRTSSPALLIPPPPLTFDPNPIALEDLFLRPSPYCITVLTPSLVTPLVLLNALKVSFFNPFRRAQKEEAVGQIVVHVKWGREK